MLELIARGLLNKEIAVRLEVSYHTVRNHMCNIFAKTQVPNRTALALFALANGYAPLHETVGLFYDWRFDLKRRRFE